MPKYDFDAWLSVRELLPIWNSVAAHIAAKLQHFGSDERTLTDEICDMVFIWARLHHALKVASPLDDRLQRVPGTAFRMRITKTTAPQEGKVGNDFWLSVIDASGRRKRAAFQSKVLDITTGQLRCATPSKWETLRKQLVKMRRHNGKLSFLLVYVPMTYLDGGFHGFGTWEQGYDPVGPTTTGSRYGVTAIPCDAIIDGAGNWIYTKYVEHLGAAQFAPAGVSLTQLIAELLLCRRGSWNEEGMATRWPGDERTDARVELSLSFAETQSETWNELLGSLELAERLDLW